MNRILVIILFQTLIFPTMKAQNKSTPLLPYEEITELPEQYTAGTVAARMVDGLGFRYYWGTDGLREEDMKFRPTDESRTIFETMVHIYQLCGTIQKSLRIEKNDRSDPSSLSYKDLRQVTLIDIKEISEILMASDDETFKQYSLVIGSGESKTILPFWNQINGPIADALWHVGQIVTIRRMSGNPFTNDVNLFQGKKR